MYGILTNLADKTQAFQQIIKIPVESLSLSITRAIAKSSYITTITRRQLTHKRDLPNKDKKELD